ncbi:MAG: alpha/beta hydrolase-fold protein [Thermoplasmata archaeon]
MIKKSRFNVERRKIAADSLRHNPLRDPVERDLLIISKDMRDGTPALVGLAGFFGSAYTFLMERYAGMDFMDVINYLATKVHSFLIVLPDTMTSYFGNQYVNSEAVGNYENFIAKDVVRFINREYGKRNIGIFGKSSGGFGAYTIAAKHPDAFRGFVDVSGDSAFEYCYLRDFPTTIAELSKRTVKGFTRYFSTLKKPSNQEMSAMSIIAAAAFYSPKKNGGIDLPFDLKNFMVKEDVWERWLSFDPVRNARLYADNLREEKVILQVGRRDEFSLNIGIKALSNILKEEGIRHEYKEYDDGHFGIEYFYQDSLPSLIRALS